MRNFTRKLTLIESHDAKIAVADHALRHKVNPSKHSIGFLRDVKPALKHWAKSEKHFARKAHKILFSW
jgi:hypothetical protein